MTIAVVRVQVPPRVQKNPAFWCGVFCVLTPLIFHTKQHNLSDFKLSLRAFLGAFMIQNFRVFLLLFL